MHIETHHFQPIIPLMGYQFIHVEAYARTGSKQTKTDSAGRSVTTTKRSARDVAAEAEREADACPHVENPKAPRLLYGVSPSEAVEAATAWADQATDAKGRKLRKDGHCLLAGVVSMPDERAADWPAFRADALDWLKTRYGDRLRSAVEHTDEAHPHLHFYVVPRPGEAFAEIHDGQKAARLVAAAGLAKGKQNAAYIAAMRQFQDDFSAGPGQRFGLTRRGPGRRRLTRAQWRAEKAQARSLALPLRPLPPAPPIPDYQAPPGKKIPLMGERYDAEALAAAYQAGIDAGYNAAQSHYAPLVENIRSVFEMEAEQVKKRAAKAQKAPENAPDTFVASVSTLTGLKLAKGVSEANRPMPPTAKKPTGPGLG